MRDYQLIRDRKRRQIKRPSRFQDGSTNHIEFPPQDPLDLIAFTLTISSRLGGDKPKSYKKVIDHIGPERWKESMEDEMS